VRRGAAVALGALLALGLASCRSPDIDYQHSRYDYLAFRARFGSAPEPNYLPYAAHLEKLPGGGRALVMCRWPNSAFPLRYYVVPPSIPERLQDEFNPRAPEEYVEAVKKAFRRWEQELGRPVRFRPVDDPSQAVLTVHLRAETHPEEEVLVLGMVRDQAHRCRVTGLGADVERVKIEFAVSDVELFIADSIGLLTPRQVQGVALHEIGHVLGAAGHSPLQADVMFQVATDRRGNVVSLHDRNTFRALYGVPPGAVYRRLDEQYGRPMVEARRGPPRLGPETRDDRFGFEIRFPREWQTIRTPRGAIAVDGVSWDYDASIQVIAVRGTLSDFVARQGPRLARRGEFVGSDRLELDGRPLARFVTRTADMTEMTTVLDWREGWLLVVIADCQNQNFALYEPWFQQVLLSLQPLEEAGAGGAAEPPPREGGPARPE
jgi:hypothetical protein